MPRIRLTKTTIDALPTPSSEQVYWDESLPGFGVKVTPAGRKVFVVLYRTSGAGSRLRKYTIGPYGRVTLHVARGEAQRVLAARTEGRDPASEKREARRRLVTDGVDELVEAYIKNHVSKRRSSGEVSRILKRELVGRWGTRSIHEVTRRDIIELVSEIVDRGAPVAANKTLRWRRRFSAGALERRYSSAPLLTGSSLPHAKRRATGFSLTTNSLVLCGLPGKSEALLGGLLSFWR
jgi:hypothetical protein